MYLRPTRGGTVVWQDGLAEKVHVSWPVLSTKALSKEGKVLIEIKRYGRGCGAKVDGRDSWALNCVGDGSR